MPQSGGSLRQSTGTVAAGLGMFLVVIALLLRFYVIGAAAKFPLNTYTVSTLMGHNVSYFSSSKVTELSGVTMRVTNTTEGDGSSGNSSRAVYTSFSYLYDLTNKQPFSYSTTRMAFDRKTGALLNCCGSSVDSNRHVHMSGLGMLFPLGTKQQSYQLFNLTLLKPVTARYVGQATVDGLTTYKFVSQVPPTQVGTKQVPGSMIGSTQPAVSLNEFYQSTLTDYVNPTTGVPVSVTQQQHIALRDATGAEKLVLFNGTLKSTPASVQSAVNTVNKNVNLLNIATLIVPLAAGIVGAVLLVLGIILYMQARRQEMEEYAEEY